MESALLSEAIAVSSLHGVSPSFPDATFSRSHEAEHTDKGKQANMAADVSAKWRDRGGGRSEVRELPVLHHKREID